MPPQEIIRRKRDGEPLSAADIDAFVTGIVTGAVGEAQMAAFAMAVVLRGMTEAETVALTRAMAHSGTVLDWSREGLDGPVLDKHSTGGVGDKVSLLLAPIVAACGGYVPMVSGRGLGHTGGTLDKLAAIPGYAIHPEPAAFRRVVKAVGCAIIGATDDLAPADRRLYAVRDITATVESRPLITASILSKKLAAGLQGLVMDVKVGSGAFLPGRADAALLAETIVAVGRDCGLRVTALLTDMDQVLGGSAGNALEVAETIGILTTGTGDARLIAVTLALAAEMLHMGGLAGTVEAARDQARRALDGRRRGGPLRPDGNGARRPPGSAGSSRPPSRAGAGEPRGGIRHTRAGSPRSTCAGSAWPSSDWAAAGPAPTRRSTPRSGSAMPPASVMRLRRAGGSSPACTPGIAKAPMSRRRRSAPPIRSATRRRGSTVR